MIRTELGRRAGLPLRKVFIHMEDIEYLSRLDRLGAMWLVTGAVVRHKEPPDGLVTRPTFDARLRDFSTPRPFAQEWKRLYSLRNMIHVGRLGRYVSVTQALSYVVVALVRTALFGERGYRRRTAFLAALYGYDGLARGVSQCSPRSLAEARRGA